MSNSLVVVLDATGQKFSVAENLVTLQYHFGTCSHVYLYAWLIVS